MIIVTTGITGQTGSYFAELLLKEEHYVIGLKRRNSTNNNRRIKNILDHPNFKLLEFDLTDFPSIIKIIKEYDPDFIVNFAAQSHVHTSFEQPICTFNTTAGGVLNILEAINLYSPSTGFIQLSSSEMFGDSINPNGFQDENTPFNPRSPYAVSKVTAYYFTRLYRSYGIYASNVIMFNCESPRRGENFVTRKITKYVADLYHNRTKFKLHLGNIKSYRDWGYAGDYVECIYEMMYNPPDDFVVATGNTYSVEDFLSVAFSIIGKKWEEYVEIDKSLIRPLEVPVLKGDSSKARRVLGWEPKVKFEELVRIMVESDIKNV